MNDHRVQSIALAFVLSLALWVLIIHYVVTR